MLVGGGGRGGGRRFDRWRLESAVGSRTGVGGESERGSGERGGGGGDCGFCGIGVASCVAGWAVIGSVGNGAVGGEGGGGRGMVPRFVCFIAGRPVMGAFGGRRCKGPGLEM